MVQQIDLKMKFKFLITDMLKESAMLQDLKRETEPLKQAILLRNFCCRTVLKNNEVDIVLQLVQSSTLDEEILETFLHEFCNEVSYSKRLELLREVCVEGGETSIFKNLLTSADQLDYNELLYTVCKKGTREHRKEMVQLLLPKENEKIRADVDARILNKTVFHMAAERAQHDILKAVTPQEGPDALTYNGETALHCLIRCARDPKFKNSQEDVLKCVEILVNDLITDINIRDRIDHGYTAVHLACINQLWDIVAILLSKNCKINIQINSKTTRDIIREKKPELLENYIERDAVENEIDIKTQLFELLNKNQEDQFIDVIDENVHLINSNNGRFTLLQLAVYKNLSEATQKLLDLGADTNKNCGDLHYPIMIAASQCNSKILGILLKNKNIDLTKIKSKKDMQNALHLAIINSKVDCKCVKMILEKCKTFDINAQDCREKTALHHAVDKNNEKIIESLLSNHANIFIQDDDATYAYEGIDTDILNGFLDDQISVDKSNHLDNGVKALILDYSFLIIPKNTSDTIETSNNSVSPLLIEKDHAISDMEALTTFVKNKNYKSLINHILIKSFLHLKWHKFLWIFYLNFIILSIFTFSLGFYIYDIIVSVDEKNAFNNNTSVDNNEASTMVDTNSFTFYTLCRILAIITWFYLFVREIFQFLVSQSFIHYISYIVNIIEIILIFLSAYLLFNPPSHNYARHTMCAFAIILSFAELSLLIGRHPVLTVYYTMLYRVTLNFIYFLTWYSLLIFAFGFSFFTLFKECGEKKDEGCFFKDVPTSLFKTVAMLQGEFETGDLEFDSVYITSHLIFLFFFFLMVIVLMNLLNGLAVNDIQEIKIKSELICCEYQIKCYSKFEYILSNTDLKLSFLNCLRDKIKNNSLLLSGYLPQNKMEYLLDDNHQFIPEIKDSTCMSCTGGRVCCFELSCLKSKHFRKLCPLCYEFENMMEEMIILNKQRQKQNNKIKQEENEDKTNYLEERQERLENLVFSLDQKLDSLMTLFQEMNMKLNKNA